MILNAFHVKFHAWNNGIPPSASRPQKVKNQKQKNYVQDGLPNKQKNIVQNMGPQQNTKKQCSGYVPKKYECKHTCTNADANTSVRWWRWW